MVWRIDTTTNTGVLSMPTIVGTPGYFQPGNLSVIPTQVDWGWLNRVQEEQANLVLAAGQSLNPTLYNQMATSVSIIASNAGYTLTGTKVTSALGYTPVNKAGDTMTAGLNVPYIKATGNLTGAQWASYGSYFSWNYTNGVGETDFFNSNAGAPGGFNFYNVNSNATATPSLLASISSTGTLTATSANLNTLIVNTISASYINSSAITTGLGFNPLSSTALQNAGGYIGAGVYYGTGWQYSDPAGDYGFYLRQSDANGVAAGTGGALSIGFATNINTGAGSTASIGTVFTFDKNGYFYANAINASAITTGLGYTPVNKAGDTMTTPLFVGSGVGSVSLDPGGSLNTGYIAFFNATGVRQGYIGYGAPGSNIVLETEGSATGYAVTANLYVGQAFGVGGTATLNSGVQIWNGATITSGVLTAGSASFTSATITGVTNASNAATGQVGEFISATISAASPVALTSQVATNITSISLSAGDWDIWGNVCSSVAGTTVTIWMYGAISTTSSTIPAQPNNGGSGLSGAMAAGATSIVNVGRMRLNVSTTTVVYLVADMNFTTSTAAAIGFIGARRVR